ncbi:hypothetical protein N9358_02090 [Flavobacteriales bacterium]|nr:hypothetical protein [Flavobacteriales bacterium]
MDISKSARSTLILLFFTIAVHVMGQSGNQLIRIHTVSNVSSLGSITNALEGNLIYVESTDAIYYYDGSNWVNLSSTSSSSSTNWELVGNVATSSDFLGTTNNTDLDIRTNNIQRMTVKNNGRVGIGTDNPSGIFEIGSGTNEISSSDFTLSGSTNTGFPLTNTVDNDESTFSQQGRFNVSASNPIDAMYIGFNAPVTITAYSIKSGGTANNAPSSFYMQGRVDALSNWVSLDSINTVSSWTSNSTPSLETHTFNTQNSTPYSEYRLLVTDVATTPINFGPNQLLSYLQIIEIDLFVTLGNDFFLVDDNGNVGIAIENPTEKLHVGGNILASGTITPDYVFEHYFEGESLLKPEYQFTELEKTIEFAKKHHHLPNIPSAEEVKEKGGILLNKAVEQNLEKIEELYLHLYQTSKEIEELELLIQKID